MMMTSQKQVTFTVYGVVEQAEERDRCYDSSVGGFDCSDQMKWMCSPGIGQCYLHFSIFIYKWNEPYILNTEVLFDT